MVVSANAESEKTAEIARRSGYLEKRFLQIMKAYRTEFGDWKCDSRDDQKSNGTLRLNDSTYVAPEFEDYGR